MRVCEVRKRCSSSAREGTVSLGCEAEKALFSPQSLYCLMALSVIAPTRPLPLVVRSMVSSFMMTGTPSPVRRTSARIAPAPALTAAEKEDSEFSGARLGLPAAPMSSGARVVVVLPREAAAFLAAEAEGAMTMFAPEAAASISAVSFVTVGQAATVSSADCSAATVSCVQSAVGSAAVCAVAVSAASVIAEAVIPASAR